MASRKWRKKFIGHRDKDQSIAKCKVKNNRAEGSRSREAKKAGSKKYKVSMEWTHD